MKTILFPTDFSDTANNALEFAVSICKAGKASIQLFHVYGPPVIDPQMPPGMAAELMTDMENTSNEQLKMLSNALKAEGIAVKFESIPGFVASEIVEKADSIKADMIVMGTTGAAGLIGKLMGSNASTVVQESHCPVMLIPSDAEYRSFDHIAYASQFEADDLPALTDLLIIAKLFNSRIDIVKINTTQQIQPDIFADEPQIQRIIEEFGKDQFQFISHDDVSVIAGLDHYLTAQNTDLLVMTTRRRTFFEKILEPSVTRKMVLHSHLPMLIFHQH
ncbi:MAG: universal stress protein [Saprospiraceae bacterium]